MITDEGLPTLRRRSPSPRHVFCNRGLSDIDAKLEQFTVYPGSAPKRVGDTYFANEAANVCRCRRSATARSGLPAPIGSEAGTVPADQRLRPYDLLSVQSPGSQPIFDAAEGHSVRGLAPVRR